MIFGLGIFWLVLFGDDPWPEWTDIIFGPLPLVVFLIVVSLFILLGVRYGKKKAQDADQETAVRVAKKRLLVALVVWVLCIAAVAAFIFSPRATIPNSTNIIADPETGILILRDELIILTSGQNVEDVIAEFNGRITLSVLETGTYQVKFPVSNLEELNAIRDQLNERGVQASYATFLQPLRPGEPQ